MRRVAVSTEQTLGLDTSTVSVETVPLIIETRQTERIRKRPGSGTGAVTPR